MTAVSRSPSVAQALPYPRPVYAWTVVAILVCTAILSYTDRQVLSLLVDPIRKDLRIDDTQISLLLGTAFAVIYGIAGIPLGWLADRISRRNLITAGILVWSLGTVGCGFSRNFTEIFASRLLVGLGEATLSPAAISLISDYFPPEKRGAAVGLFLSGIAMGIGASILVGGGVLKVVELGLFSHSAFAHLEPWRLVLLLIGAPGLIWCAATAVIKEPVRRLDDPAADQTASDALLSQSRSHWMRAAPVYLAVAMASLVDNAVGAWGPSLLIRRFAMNAAEVGFELGPLLTIAFGGGVLVGGFVADRAGALGGWPYKLGVCLIVSLLVVLDAQLISAPQKLAVLLGIPVYFALSGIVTATGFSAILDVVPGRARGLAMSISFFLNVAIGGGIGPTAVALAARYLFGTSLGPAITLTAAGGLSDHHRRFSRNMGARTSQTPCSCPSALTRVRS